MTVRALGGAETGWAALIVRASPTWELNPR